MQSLTCKSLKETLKAITICRKINILGTVEPGGVKQNDVATNFNDLKKNITFDAWNNNRYYLYKKASSGARLRKYKNVLKQAREKKIWC